MKSPDPFPIPKFQSRTGVSKEKITTFFVSRAAILPLSCDSFELVSFLGNSKSKIFVQQIVEMQ